MKAIYYLIFFTVIPIQAHCQLNSFYIGIFTNDFNNPTYYNCGFPEPHNTDKLGHDTAYLSSLKRDNFNLIIAWTQYLKPFVQYVNKAATAPDKSFLDRAQKQGLSVIAAVPELYYDVLWEVSPEWKTPYYASITGYNAAKSARAVSYYKSHKALIGWLLADESGEQQWPVLAALTRDIKKLSGGKLPYINLLPVGALSGQYLKGKSNETGKPTTQTDYESYLQSYIKTVRPTVLSVDNYNPKNLFMNLEIIRKNAVKNNLPFVWVITTGGSGEYYDAPGYCEKYRSTSYGECAFKIFSPMIYGAKGLNYFTREALLGNETSYRSKLLMRSTYDGIVPEMRKYMAELHKRLTDKSGILMSLNIFNIYHKSFNSTYYENTIDSIQDFQSWNYISGNNSVKLYFSNAADPFKAANDTIMNTLVVSFGKDNKQQDYFWVFNKHLSQTIEIMPGLKTGVSIFNVLDDMNHSSLKSISLNPGEAKLFRFTKKLRLHISIPTRPKSHLKNTPVNKP